MHSGVFDELRILYGQRGNSAKLTHEEGGLRFLVIRSLRKNDLVCLCESHQLPAEGGVWELRERLFVSAINENEIFVFVREQYNELRHESREVDESVKLELRRVQTYQSSAHLGNIDGALQQAVRRYHVFSELEQAIRDDLLPRVENYVKWSWYNHWTETVINNMFTDREAVIPTLRKVKAVDFFLSRVPFDLKLTFLPKGFLDEVERNQDSDFGSDFEKITYAIGHARELAKWLYGNQGPVRFDNSNRFFMILVDTDTLDHSWRLKSDFELVDRSITNFLRDVSDPLVIDYHYDKSDVYLGDYRAQCHILFILSSAID